MGKDERERRRPSREVRQGESPLVVFVSSRIAREVAWAREAAVEVLNEADWLTPWLFERTPPSTQALDESYLSKVRTADLVVWLVETETTAAVRREIRTALETGRRILMFRVSPPPSSLETESLVEEVNAKWTFVADAADLKTKFQNALNDELVRAWRETGRPTTPAVLESDALRSRARCIERWLAAGLTVELAGDLADDSSVGVQKVPFLAPDRFALLCGGVGSGKSLAAERLYQDALNRAREGQTARPFFVEAKSVVGSLEARLEWSVGNGHRPTETCLVVVDGLDEAPPDRRLELARAARRLSIESPLLQVLVTSRPLPVLTPEFDRVVINIPPLSRGQTLELIRRIAGHAVDETIFWGWPESLAEAMRWPLFSILVGLSERVNQSVRVSKGRLLSRLVESALAACG